LVQELGISPANILCMTFTNKAAREMKYRLRRLLGVETDTSFVATLHSFCTRVLREDIGKLFFPETFVVLDVSDQKSILEEVYEELSIRMDTATFETMLDKIRYEKNLLDYMPFMVSGTFADVKPRDLEHQVMLRYMEKQKKYFGLDFFDLINFAIYLFKTHRDVLLKWQFRLHYIMVDEFQDITAKEFKLIRHLTEAHQNFFVVGDPDQNIYEWRGSRMEVLMDFEANLRAFYAGDNTSYMGDHIIPPLTGAFTTIFLNQNYRSTPQILNASNALISKNINRIEKALAPTLPDGQAVEHFHGKSDAHEIEYIVQKIREHTEAGGSYADHAILYRAQHVSRFIEAGLLKHNIPYTVYGGVGFYERREIKDVLCYLRLVAHGDDLSFLRVVNTPRRRMGKNRVLYLRNRAAEDDTTLYNALRRHIDNPLFKDSGAKHFIETIENAKSEAQTLAVSELLQRLLRDSGYESYIRQSGEMERLDNVSELLRSIVQRETEHGEPLPLHAFLQDVALHRDTEEDEKRDTVRIMTAHSAKGLEFHTVFVAGLNERTFPSIRALDERREDALEEERRLAYVAMTRARRRLYLTESEGHGIRGHVKTPSRFLFDIGDEHITRIGHISAEIMAEHTLQAVVRKPSPERRFTKGDPVKHKVFGEGVVETADDGTKTYFIRFLTGLKPIRYEYAGLS
jgi:DNA helicase-2/ATP-dependent DNA helicase PcrA